MAQFEFGAHGSHQNGLRLNTNDEEDCAGQPSGQKKGRTGSKGNA
jgi:hypothetical protein